MFEFYFNTRVCFGVQSRSNISTILKNESWDNVGIVVDHNVSKTDAVNDLVSAIKDYCDSTIIDYCTISEPTYDFLDDMRNTFDDKNLQAIIGIGGGSSLDAAKAMAVLANNKKSAISYRGFDKMTEPVLPTIAIPTTAGTGSEVTPNASFIDTNDERKMGINGEAIRPKYAILDPELTISCPIHPTVSAAVDSIVHAVEAHAAKKTNDLARMFAREGFKLVFTNLPLVVDDPTDIVCREGVMYGAFLSGVALMISGTGPAAAMSYPLGVHCKIPHGIGGGIFLPQVINYNIQKGYYQYSGLYDGIDDVSSILTEQEKAQSLLERIVSLWKVLSIPDDLTALGFEHDFAQQFVQETMELGGALEQNPVPFDEEEVISVLKKLKVSV